MLKNKDKVIFDNILKFINNNNFFIIKNYLYNNLIMYVIELKNKFNIKTQISKI